MPRRTGEQAAAAPTGPLRLVYTGGGIPPADVPMRDLDEADLHRVHRVRSLLASGGEPVDAATAADLEAVAASLEATGAWSREQDTTTEAPAEPAEQE